MRTQPITLTAVGALLVGVAACLDVADMASPTPDPEPVGLDGQSSEWPPPGYVPFTLHGWMTGELGREYTREDVEEMGIENAELLLYSTLLAKRERELEELLAQPDAHERTTRYGLNMVEALKCIRHEAEQIRRREVYVNGHRECQGCGLRKCQGKGMGCSCVRGALERFSGYSPLGAWAAALGVTPLELSGESERGEEGDWLPGSQRECQAAACLHR